MKIDDLANNTVKSMAADVELSEWNWSQICWSFFELATHMQSAGDVINCHV